MLLEHARSNPVPREGRLAWLVWQRLASPTVRKYGLQELAMRTFSLELTQSQVAKLLADLDEIEAGISRAHSSQDQEG